MPTLDAGVLGAAIVGIGEAIWCLKASCRSQSDCFLVRDVVIVVDCDTASDRTAVCKDEDVLSQMLAVYVENMRNRGAYRLTAPYDASRGVRDAARDLLRPVVHYKFANPVAGFNSPDI